MTAGQGADFAFAALRHERVVQRHLVHRARPDQQRVGRVRCALIAVAGAFHDEAQIVVAREIHRRRDVAARSRLHRIGAGRRRPGVEPAGDLRAAGLVAEIERIADVRERVDASRAAWVRSRRRRTAWRRDQIAADRLVQLCPARRARPGGVAGPHAAERRTASRPGRRAGQEIGLQGDVAAIPFSMLRLRISTFTLPRAVALILGSRRP